jgi:50S ribosomal protein L16 3-hydroxylase
MRKRALVHKAMDTVSPAPLGGFTPSAFMSQYWQKKPLLIRVACSPVPDLLSRDRLIDFASRDDVDARLVIRERSRYSLAHGPFVRREFRKLPPTGWTLLVQGVNRVDAACDRLLRSFSFLPYARLDDVMASYAAPGGGVGPHFDSYDVFLLQGSGRRRWRYGRQRDLTLAQDVELKILRRFSPQHDTVLAPGDMLYLPPSVAHDGVAIDACVTYSIGFRAATYAEIAQAFIDFLRDDLRLSDGRYSDSGAKPTPTPARIDPAMRRRIMPALAMIRWGARDVDRFLGSFLSEPKAVVRFEAPARPIAKRLFTTTIGVRGLALDRATQLLYDDGSFYVNGEPVGFRGAGIAMLRRLANRRALSSRECRTLPAPAVALLHQWYRYGFVEPLA